jgi:hypothetical protein
LSCLEDTIAHGPPGGRARPHVGASRRHTGSRFRRGHSLTPRQVEIFAAVPRGHRRARSQRAWLDHVKAHPDYLALRSDRQANWREIIGILALRADWTDRTTRPTWPLIAREAHVSRATVARCIAWLIARGLLGVVESGTTPMFRCGVLYGLDPDAENRAAEYVLTVRTPPPRRRRSSPSCESGGQTQTETPSLSRNGTRSTPTRARAADTSHPGRLAVRPETRTEMRIAAEALQQRVPLLRELSAEHLRHLLRPYWAVAGWTPADVLHCLDHRPDGRQQPYSDRVRYVPGWIRYRLSAWHDADGMPMSSPSQLREQHRCRIRAEQDARRRERERAEAMVADYTRRAAEARRQLAEVHADAAQAMRRADLFLAAAASPSELAPEAPTTPDPIPAVTPARDARDWATVARTLLSVRDASSRDAIIAAARADDADSLSG